MTKLVLGPVLSYRGGAEQGIWKITALIGIAEQDSIPVLACDGTVRPAPVELLRQGGCVFLRYDLSCEQEATERKVAYSISGVTQEWEFSIPANNTAPRMAYVSCNGSSEDINKTENMMLKGRSINDVWTDLLYNHDKSLRPASLAIDKEQLWHDGQRHDTNAQRFHLLVMGGDQLYSDSIWYDLKPLKAWHELPRDKRLKWGVSATLDQQLSDYYINLYKGRWLNPKRPSWDGNTKGLDAALAMASIPTIMMWDDHDIFDGWGSYHPDMQQCPVFQRMFYHARRAFWVMQMQHPVHLLPQPPLRNPAVQPDTPIFAPIRWHQVLQADPLALPIFDDQPGFSFAHTIGPVSLLVADLRTERGFRQVMGPDTYRAIKQWLAALESPVSNPAIGCQHMLFISSVPVIHPKLLPAEIALDNFGTDDVMNSLADDLKDHWTNRDHEGERKQLLEILQQTARDKRIRVTIVSGDVHVAAWGVSYRKDVVNADNWSQINQLTSSAVVHPSLVTLPQRLLLMTLNSCAKSRQEIDINLVADMMQFPAANSYLKAARNWLALEVDTSAGPANIKLWASWRCEAVANFSNHLLAISSVQG